MANVGIDISSLDNVRTSLNKFKAKQIPFATSRAMEKTVRQAVHDAKVSAANTLDRPTEIITRPGVNKGAIRGNWPSKADVKRGFEKANGEARPAAVFVLGISGANGNKSFDLTQELHAVVFGGTLRHVPDTAFSVITPTNALMKGLAGRGRLRRLNRYGNIRGFRDGVLAELKNNTRNYLDVPLSYQPKQVRHLTPGLYLKIREVSKGGLLRDNLAKRSNGSRRGLRNVAGIAGKRGRLTMRSNAVRASGRAKRKAGRVRTVLVKLLTYERTREQRSIWDYPGIVQASYLKHYDEHFTNELAIAIATSKF